MQDMTDICCLPSPWGKGYKWPKLHEAHRHCFGKEFEDAHDALADVRACAKVFFWLQQHRKKVLAVTTA
jgi:DNA polymerase III subunit epsilon